MNIYVSNMYTIQYIHTHTQYIYIYIQADRMLCNTGVNTGGTTSIILFSAILCVYWELPVRQTPLVKHLGLNNPRPSILLLSYSRHSADFVGGTQVNGMLTKLDFFIITSYASSWLSKCHQAHYDIKITNVDWDTPEMQFTFYFYNVNIFPDAVALYFGRNVCLDTLSRKLGTSQHIDDRNSSLIFSLTDKTF